MRFALIATSVAALAAVPTAAVLSAPTMGGHEFLTAVRCAAYDTVTDPNGEYAAVRYQLNVEARRQPVETAVQARAEAGAIAREAAGIVKQGDTAILDEVRASVCSEAGAQVARGAGAPNAA